MVAFSVGKILYYTLCSKLSLYPTEKNEVTNIGAITMGCVCVCIGERGEEIERERKSKREREREREREEYEQQAASGTCNQKDYR